MGTVPVSTPTGDPSTLNIGLLVRERPKDVPRGLCIVRTQYPMSLETLIKSHYVSVTS